MKKILTKKNLARITAGIIVIAMLATTAAGFFMGQRPQVKPVTAGAEAHTSARAMCTIEANSGRVLYQKNADAQIPMASTTKIVTAITAIELANQQGLDLDAKITIDDRAIGIEGTSIYLQKGEELSIRELLYGLMLRSGNDASMALALALCKTNEEFCEKMQEVSQRVGAINSNYKNPHGLDEEGHYTTARDLALITAYAMKNPIFAEIAKTKEVRIDGKEYPRVLQNKNRLLRQLDGCVGVKTGFTKKAGRCFVGARDFNGMTVVCVVLNCGPMFEESAEIMQQADTEFTMRRLIGENEFIGDMQGVGIADFYYPLTDAETNQISTYIEGNEVIVKFNDKEIHRAQCNVL